MKGALKVDHCVSIKFNVLHKIAEALRPQLIVLQAESSEDGFERLKIDKPDPTKRYITLRFTDWGGNAIESVAEAKARIENLLAGTVVTEARKIHAVTLGTNSLEPSTAQQSAGGKITTTEHITLWHAWFGTQAALMYFAELSRRYGLLITRNKYQLMLYGGTDEVRYDVCEILSAKCRHLSLHDIVRSSNLPHQFRA